MNSKKYIKKGNKRGSYIVEAALTLPVFIIAIMAIALLVDIISICGNIGYITAKEVRNIDVNAYMMHVGGTLEAAKLKTEVEAENPRLTDFRISKFRYLYSDGMTDDLIAIETNAEFNVIHTIGISGRLIFKEGLLSRGFTGRFQDSQGLDVSEFEKNSGSEVVVVFPHYGVRYHDSECRYAVQNYYGEEYKIEIEKEDAIRKGYTPCLICHGGDAINAA